MLWLSDNYLLMLMLKLSLLLVYHVISAHVISETYVQLVTITHIFCMENYICMEPYCKSCSSNVKSKLIKTRC